MVEGKNSGEITRARSFGCKTDREGGAYENYSQ